MRNLSVYQRFAMIIAALTIVLFAVSALQILVLQAAQGAQEVMQNITGVREASSKVNAAATLVLNAAAQLTSQSEQLETETGKFLGNIRAA